MPTIVGILTCMSSINFVLSWDEHGKSFITSGLEDIHKNKSNLKIVAKYVYLFNQSNGFPTLIKMLLKTLFGTPARKITLDEWCCLQPLYLQLVGMTIAVKNDYWDSTDNLTLQEVLLRYYYYCWLLLQYYCDTIVWNIYACLKEKIKNIHVRVPIFVWKQEKNSRILSKSTYFAEMHGMQQQIHLIAK